MRQKQQARSVLVDQLCDALLMTGHRHEVEDSRVYGLRLLVTLMTGHRHEVEDSRVYCLRLLVTLMTGHRHEVEDKTGYQAALSRQQQAAEANMGYTTNVSQQLIAKLKTKRFTQIFEYLDQVRCPGGLVGSNW